MGPEKPTARDVPLSAHFAEVLARRPAGVFLDCLHVDPPLLSALGRVTGERHYTRAALEQARGYESLLQRPEGLFDHFALDGAEDTSGPGWGRGQGWAILGVLDVLDEITDQPELDPVDDLHEALTRLGRRMVDLQRPDGHWCAVVDRDGSGDETSTAAFMGAPSPRLARWAPELADELTTAAGRARGAVLDDLDDEALLTGVSAAVDASTEPRHHHAVRRRYAVPWGQGPAVPASA